MSDNKYDLSNAKVVGVVVKDPEKEKEKREADERFRKERSEAKTDSDAYVQLKSYFMSE